MAPKKEKKKVQYYTVVFEKYIEVMEEVNRLHYLLSDKIKELTNKVHLTEWVDSPISDFMECFIIVNSYKIFLEEKINNPSEEEIIFTTTNSIKDVLFNEKELEAMQNFYIEMEARRVMLYKDYGFSTEYN